METDRCLLGHSPLESPEFYSVAAWCLASLPSSTHRFNQFLRHLRGIHPISSRLKCLLYSRNLIGANAVFTTRIRCLRSHLAKRSFVSYERRLRPIQIRTSN